jgi:predicted hydrocarbon binding protein
MGCYVSRAVVHSIMPLAVLEAVRNLDTPVEDGLTEFAEELLSKRLGLSPTVAMQLAEYEVLVRRDGRVGRGHVEALLRLVGRRPDADLVFAEAGRRAARRAVRRLRLVSRLGARAAPRVLGFRAARRMAKMVLAADLRREAHVPIAVVQDTLAVVATPDGAACALYAAAFSELLRLLVGIEVAMVHTSCRAAGAPGCEWRAAAADPRHS